jgi:hypothetical protein
MTGALANPLSLLNKGLQWKGSAPTHRRLRGEGAGLLAALPEDPQQEEEEVDEVEVEGEGAHDGGPPLRFA